MKGIDRMKIYYFATDIQDTKGMGTHVYGTGEYEKFETKEELIDDAEGFIRRKLTKKEKQSIITKEVPDYDYYSIQCFEDGFGNDTYTLAVFLTKEECVAYGKEHYKEEDWEIVGQYWGAYRNLF